MAIWISLAVVLCLIPGHDSASTKIGCVNAVKVISSNGTLTYTCQAQNKDNDIIWISNGERAQIFLAKCLNGSTTCLTTDPSVHASRTETGRSELKIIGSVGGKDIKCYESSDSEEVTCSQSTTAVTSTTGQGNHNSDNQSEPSAGSKISSENPSFTPFVVSMTSVQDVTREKTSEASSPSQTASAILSEQFLVTTTLAPTGKPFQDSNPTFTKTTIVGVSTLEGHPITDATVFSPQTLKTSEDTVKDSTTINKNNTAKNNTVDKHPRLQSTTAVTATTRPGNQSSDSNPTSTKTTITGVSNQIFTRDERTKQPSSAVSTVFDRVTELSSQNNITEVSAHGDSTESQGYVYTETIGEETSSGGVNLTTASTTTVSPVTDSTQTLVLEVSHIIKIPEISPQTSTSGSTMSSLPVSPEKFFTSKDVNTDIHDVLPSTTMTLTQKKDDQSFRDLLVAALAVTCITLVVICLAAAIFLVYYKTKKRWSRKWLHVGND